MFELGRQYSFSQYQIFFDHKQNILNIKSKYQNNNFLGFYILFQKYVVKLKDHSKLATLLK